MILLNITPRGALSLDIVCRKNVARRKMPAPVCTFDARLCRRDEIIRLLKLILVARARWILLLTGRLDSFHSRRPREQTNSHPRDIGPFAVAAHPNRVNVCVCGSIALSLAPPALCTLANNFHARKSRRWLRMWESIQVTKLRSEWGCCGEFPLLIVDESAQITF